MVLLDVTIQLGRRIPPATARSGLLLFTEEEYDEKLTLPAGCPASRDKWQSLTDSQNSGSKAQQPQPETDSYESGPCPFFGE